MYRRSANWLIQQTIAVSPSVQFTSPNQKQNFMALARKSAQFVCQIRSPDAQERGTGLLVGQKFVITNSKVLKDRETASKSCAYFFRVTGADSHPKATVTIVPIEFAPQDYFYQSVPSNDGMGVNERYPSFTVVALKSHLHLWSLRGQIPSPFEASAPKPGDPVCVFQYPDFIDTDAGLIRGDVRIALGSVTEAGPSEVRYQAPTFDGLAQGAVIDSEGNLIALHDRSIQEIIGDPADRLNACTLIRGIAPVVEKPIADWERRVQVYTQCASKIPSTLGEGSFEVPMEISLGDGESLEHQDHNAFPVGMSKEMTLHIRQQVLACTIETFGEMHPDTIADYHRVGLTFCALGNYEEAYKHLQRELEIRIPVLGEMQPETAKNYQDVGVVLDKLNRFDEALEYSKRALDIRREVLGVQDSETIASYGRVGVILHTLGNYEEALKYFQDALVLKQKTLGEGHSKVAASYDSLGAVFHSLKQPEKVLECLENALKIRIATVGPDDVNTARNYCQMGQVLHSLNRDNEALEYAQRALAVRLAILDECDEKIAQSCESVGEILRALKKHEEALQHFERSLQIREGMGRKDAEMAEIYLSVGGILQNLNRHEQALPYLQEAFNFGQRTLAEWDVKRAEIYEALGVTFDAMNRNEESLEYSTRALEIKRKVLGEKHPKTALSYHSVGVTLHQLKRTEEALKMSQISLDIRKEVLGEHNLAGVS